MLYYILDPDIYNNIRRDRRKKGVLQDIIDGTEYQKHVQSGFLENPDNISLSVNTDGVAIFRSSKRVSFGPFTL